MSDTPKAFISHAREDKENYAEPLARELRSKGIDAWLDKWELVPGDNLVSKIFEEGLAQAGTCIFLMSQSSVNKPWAKAELENAVAQMIEGKIRLIPVKLEECEVPNSVTNILWIDLAREGTIEKVADVIVKTLHGHSDKPPVGAKPVWVDSSKLHIRGLDKQDMIVLAIVFEAALTGYREFIQWGELSALAEEKGLDYDTVFESTQMLCEQGYLFDKDERIHPQLLVELPAQTLVSIAEALDLPVDLYLRTVAGLILNEDYGDIGAMQERVPDCPSGLLDAIIDVFEDRGFLKAARPIGGRGCVFLPSVSFKRWLRDLPAVPMSS